MRRGRIITRIATVGAVALLAPAAYAASPSEIGADLADGSLDGSYTQAELRAYLQNATVQGYDLPTRLPITETGNLPPVTPAAGGNPPAVTPVTGVAGVQTPVQKPVQKPVRTAAKPSAKVPSASVAGVQTPPLATTREVGTLPFTGIDLALLTFGGLLLLLLGLGARRLGQQRS